MDALDTGPPKMAASATVPPIAHPAISPTARPSVATAAITNIKKKVRTLSNRIDCIKLPEGVVEPRAPTLRANCEPVVIPVGRDILATLELMCPLLSGGKDHARKETCHVWSRQGSERFRGKCLELGLAPQVGLEPTTLRLTAECSAN